MSDAREELKRQLLLYSEALIDLRSNRVDRDRVKQELKEVESEIFAESVQLGKIDGKNAETRDAQALLAFKANPKWQRVSDELRRLENAFLASQDSVTITLTSLRVYATLLNVEIAETGATRLLAEVSLAVV